MNKLVNNIKSILSLTLTFVFAIMLFSPVLANAENNASVLKLKTPEDLIKFSKDCALDTYSKNLKVSLENDIDLTGIEFEPIPIFFGTFNGNNHTITSVNIISRGSKLGMFRTVQPGATVKNLNVSGSVEPKGTASHVGMIAGENYGVISSCKADGTVKGEDNIAGLVGYNKPGALISNSSSSVNVGGIHATGGIAGKNEGQIRGCSNQGDVNTSSSSVQLIPDINDIISAGEEANSYFTNSMMGKDTSSENVVEPESEGGDDDVENVGGICGYSNGNVSSCTNFGVVGYVHFGYNIGGIVGRQCGIVDNCENQGEVLGRKDVGGIVGQFEPDITLDFKGNSGENMREQIDELSTTLRNLTNTIGNSVDGSLDNSDSINDAVDVIEDTLKDVGDTENEEGGITSDSFHESVQIINDASSRMIEATKDYTEIADKEIKIINEETQNIADALDSLNDTTIEAVSNARKTINAENNKIQKQLDEIQKSITMISEALGDTEKLAKDLENAKNDDGSYDPIKVEKAYRDYIKTVELNNIEDGIKNIGKALENINGSIKVINETLKNNGDIIEDQWDSSSYAIEAALDNLNPAVERLQQASTDYSNKMTTELDIVNTEVDKIENLLKDYGDDLTDRLDLTFDTVYKQLDIINTNMDDIIKTGKATNSEVNALMNTAIDKLNEIGNSVASLTDTPEYSTVDVSETTLGEMKPGQVSTCRNSAEIYADTNVGGISGIMAIEVGNDPESDFAMKERLWGDTTALFRALVMNSTNTGEIIGKNDCIGGVVGRSDIGTVYKSDNIANITTTGGSNCGGIAGSSDGNIVQCNTVSDINGNDFIGGIVGLGMNISNCRAMSGITSDGECIGTIAGNAKGEINNNNFVREGVEGIDGVSYADKAYPLEYSAFITQQNISPIFTDLHLDFVVDDKIIKRMPIKYGSSISADDIPNLKPRKDSYGIWEEFNTTYITRSNSIKAEYLPWITTVSTDEKVPDLLVEGEFSNEASISSEDFTPNLKLGKYDEVVSAENYKIEDSIKSLDEPLKLHIRCPKKSNVSVYMSDDKSNFKKVDSTKDGMYLIVDANAKGQIVLIKSHLKDIVQKVIYIIIIFAALIIVFILITKKVKMKKGKSKESKVLDKPNKNNKIKKRKVKKDQSDIQPNEEQKSKHKHKKGGSHLKKK